MTGFLGHLHLANLKVSESRRRLLEVDEKLREDQRLLFRSYRSHMKTYESNLHDCEEKLQKGIYQPAEVDKINKRIEELQNLLKKLGELLNKEEKELNDDDQIFAWVSQTKQDVIEKDYREKTPLKMALQALEIDAKQPAAVAHEAAKKQYANGGKKRVEMFGIFLTSVGASMDQAQRLSFELMDLVEK